MAAEDWFDLDRIYDDELDDMVDDDTLAPRYQHPIHMQNCDGVPVQRKNSHTGALFVGCSNFPRCRWTRDGELTPTENKKSKPKKPMSLEEIAFKAGWHAGYADGGEGDCRMFKPTAADAWDDYKKRRK